MGKWHLILYKVESDFIQVGSRKISVADLGEETAIRLYPVGLDAYAEKEWKKAEGKCKSCREVFIDREVGNVLPDLLQGAGYVRFKGVWVSQGEAIKTQLVFERQILIAKLMKEKGLVLYNGKWVTVDEAKSLELKEVQVAEKLEKDKKEAAAKRAEQEKIEKWKKEREEEAIAAKEKEEQRKKNQEYFKKHGRFPFTKEEKS